MYKRPAQLDEKAHLPTLLSSLNLVLTFNPQEKALLAAIVQKEKSPEAIAAILSKEGAAISSQAKVFALERLSEKNEAEGFQLILNSIPTPSLMIVRMYLGTAIKNNADDIIKLLDTYAKKTFTHELEDAKPEVIYQHDFIHPLELAVKLDKPQAVQALLELGYVSKEAIKKANKLPITSPSRASGDCFYRRKRPRNKRASALTCLCDFMS